MKLKNDPKLKPLVYKAELCDRYLEVAAWYTIGTGKIPPNFRSIYNMFVKSATNLDSWIAENYPKHKRSGFTINLRKNTIRFHGKRGKIIEYKEVVKLWEKREFIIRGEYK